MTFELFVEKRKDELGMSYADVIGRAFRAIAYYEHNGEPHNPIALMYAIGRGKTVKEVNEFMKGLQ
jgi:hypothetical protein